MPDIDLEPHSYRKRDHRGVWHIKDDPKVLWIGLGIALVCLGFIFWKREEFTDLGILVGVSAMFGFCAGGVVRALFGDRL